MTSKFVCTQCDAITFEASLAYMHREQTQHEMTVHVENPDDGVNPHADPRPYRPLPRKPKAIKKKCPQCNGVGYRQHSEWVGSGENRRSVTVHDSCYCDHGTVTVYEPTYTITVSEWEELTQDND